MSDQINIAAIRRNYAQHELTEDSIASNPLTQFSLWLQEALKAEIPEPTAMVLSTVNSAGKPAARVVLLKGLEQNQFVFYTNYLSRKGRELEFNPNAALTFFWPDLERQVRIEGIVQKTEESNSDAYFAIRPRGSQIGAWVSPQSQPLPDRQTLARLTSEYEAKFTPGLPIPRPAHWGGYALNPLQVEFWQGRPNRLHDRLVFTRDQIHLPWVLNRVAP